MSLTALDRWALWPKRPRQFAIANPLAGERDRWFLWTAPLFAIGIAVYFNQSIEPHWTIAVLSLVTLAGIRVVCRSSPAAVLLLNLLCIVAAGFGAAKLRTELVRAPVLVKPIRNAIVIGYIKRVENRADKSRRITVDVIDVEDLAPRWTPARVRIRLSPADTLIASGSTARIRARIAGPPSPAMPRGYDFARAAFYQGIGAVGFALSEPELLKMEHTPPRHIQLSAALQEFRGLIGHRIETALPGEIGVMANALMTGERSGISKTTNALYRDAGIFHILSISGLHMAIMGGAVFVALRFVLAAFPYIALHYPIKKWAALGGAVATFAYLLISGGAHPTVRSFIMILIMFVAIMLDRPAIALRNVALAALIILAVMPESLFNAGFQLSFAAVVALVSAYESHQTWNRRRRLLGYAEQPPGPLKRICRGVWLFMIGTAVTTIIAGVATAPFAAFHFHTGQQYSVLTNMLAIPVSNLIVMPAALVAFVAMPLGLEAWPLNLMGIGINLMTWSARQVVALPGAVTAIPAFPEQALQLMVAGGLWFCIWRRPWRWIGILVAISGIYAATRGDRPAALIGKNGELVAVRDGTGRLAAMKSRRASYEFQRWLEADGDRRTAAEAWSRRPFRCDLEGCIGSLGQHKIIMPRSPSALVDDCRRDGLLVISFPKPASCTTTAVVLDYPTLRRYGTHAVFIQPDGSMRIENVEQYRGSRPWTQAARAATRTAQWNERRASATPGLPASSRSSRPAPTSALPSNRPEIEDDGHPLYWWR